MPAGLQVWLDRLDALPLECDGLTRVASSLLTRERIAHRAYAGRMTVRNVGDIPVHWWIAFPDGRVLDYRARMWLGRSEAVPHGLFTPAPDVHYQGEPLSASFQNPLLFQILTGFALDTYPRCPADVSSTRVDVDTTRSMEETARVGSPVRSKTDAGPNFSQSSLPVQTAATPDGMRDAIAQLVRTTPDALASAIGGLLLTTSDALADQHSTQTPNFKRWFGDSKVLNTEGKPLWCITGLMLPLRSSTRAPVKGPTTL